MPCGGEFAQRSGLPGAGEGPARTGLRR